MANRDRKKQRTDDDNSSTFSSSSDSVSQQQALLNSILSNATANAAMPQMPTSMINSPPPSGDSSAVRSQTAQSSLTTGEVSNNNHGFVVAQQLPNAPGGVPTLQANSQPQFSLASNPLIQTHNNGNIATAPVDLATASAQQQQELQQQIIQQKLQQQLQKHQQQLQQQLHQHQQQQQQTNAYLAAFATAGGLPQTAATTVNTTSDVLNLYLTKVALLQQLQGSAATAAPSNDARRLLLNSGAGSLMGNPVLLARSMPSPQEAASLQLASAVQQAAAASKQSSSLIDSTTNSAHTSISTRTLPTEDDRGKNNSNLNYPGDLPPQSSDEREWNRMFKNLVRFKERYGDCLVPHKYNEDSELGNWVLKQRRCGDQLSEERYQKLDSIGFAWSAYATWDAMYARLKEYKKKHGNCLVPKRYIQDIKLGEWVHTQRKNVDALEATSDRKRRLNDIGFVWNVQSVSWDEMYDRLCKFREKYGHSVVPQHFSDDSKLANWVHTQRKNRHTISVDRKERLDKIGFAWRV